MWLEQQPLGFDLMIDHRRLRVYGAVRTELSRTSHPTLNRFETAAGMCLRVGVVLWCVHRYGHHTHTPTTAVLARAALRQSVSKKAVAAAHAHSLLGLRRFSRDWRARSEGPCLLALLFLPGPKLSMK